MQKDPFRSFIDLVAFDREVFKTKSSISKIGDEVSDLKTKLNILKNSLDSAKEVFTEAKKFVDEKELEMKDLDQKEKEKQNLLNNVSNPKEYAALKKEIEKIKQSQHNLESTLVSAWNKLENSQKEYKQRKEEIESQITELEKTIHQKENEIKNLETYLDQHAGERKEKKQGVPEDWLEKYDIMYAQVGNPVVPVINESCSGCFYSISSQDMLALKRKKLLQCKECFRFLYLEEVMKD